MNYGSEEGAVYIAISSIKVKQRFRKDLGDIKALAQSIQKVGLLHPVVLNEKHELIAGQRRIAACRALGWEKIPAHIVNLSNLREGEIHENMARKDFTFSEMVAIKRSFEPVEKEKAMQREKSGQKPSPNLGRGRVTEIIGKYLGIGHTTLEKVEKIMEAVDRNPAKFSKLVDDLDAGDVSVDQAYQMVVREGRRDQSPSLQAGKNVGSKKGEKVETSDPELAKVEEEIDSEERVVATYRAKESARQRLQKAKKTKLRFEATENPDKLSEYVIQYVLRDREELSQLIRDSLPHRSVDDVIREAFMEVRLDPTMADDEGRSSKFCVDRLTEFVHDAKYQYLLQKYGVSSMILTCGKEVEGKKCELVVEYDASDPSLFFCPRPTTDRSIHNSLILQCPVCSKMDYKDSKGKEFLLQYDPRLNIYACKYCGLKKPSKVPLERWRSVRALFG